MPIAKMVVDDTIVLQLNLILLMLLLPYYGSQAQSPIQPAPPPSTVWDVTSVCVIVGAITVTVISVTAFLVFLRRLAQTPRDGEWPRPSVSVGGVHPEILQTFPTFVYSSVADHLKDREPLQCAVCISEFDPDDTLRLLPQCNHVFHPPCIDAWLSSHDTCPVCRADLNSSLHGAPDFSIWVDKETNQRDSPRIEVLGLGNRDDLGKGGRELKSKLKLSRSNSTGHSLVEDGACLERYTLRVPDDVKKSIMVNHGVMLQRSASYNFYGRSMKTMCWSDSDGSSRGKKNRIGFTGSAAWKTPSETR